MRRRRVDTVEAEFVAAALTPHPGDLPLVTSAGARLSSVERWVIVGYDWHPSYFSVRYTNILSNIDSSFLPQRKDGVKRTR